MPLVRNAREGLAALLERYRGLRSYADSGFVRPLKAGAEKTCWFETLFKEPQQFRFEFVRPHPYRPLRHLLATTVIGTSGSHTYFFRHRTRSGRTVEQVETVELAVAMATGISCGSAHTIGSLLLTSVGGLALQDLRRPRFRASRHFGGISCTVISAIHPTGGRVTFWFGRDDLLLRRVISHRERSEEVRLNVRANEEVSDASFEVPNAESDPIQRAE